MTADPKDDVSPEEAAQRRDELLLKLLRMPPQPRPKREHGDDGEKAKRTAKGA